MDQKISLLDLGSYWQRNVLKGSHLHNLGWFGVNYERMLSKYVLNVTRIINDNYQLSKSNSRVDGIVYCQSHCLPSCWAYPAGLHLSGYCVSWSPCPKPHVLLCAVLTSFSISNPYLPAHVKSLLNNTKECLLLTPSRKSVVCCSLLVAHRTAQAWIN